MSGGMDDIPDLDALLSGDDGDDEEQRVLAELEALKERFKQTDGYTLFNLWEGCGRDAIEDAFYGEWVKTHHPDRYNSHRSSAITALANEVFLALQDTFDRLLKREQTDAPATPRPTTPRPTSSATTPRPSSSHAATTTPRLETPAPSPSTPASPSPSSSSASTTSSAPPAAAENLFAHRPTTRRKVPEVGGDDLFTRRPSTAKRTQPRIQRPPAEGLFSRRPSSARVAAPAAEASSEPPTTTTEPAVTHPPASGSGAVVGDEGLRAMTSLEASTQGRRAKSEDSSPKARFETVKTLLRRGRQLDEANILLQGLVEEVPDNKVYATYLAWSRYLCDISEAEDVKRALKSLLEEAPDTVTEDACLFLAKIALAEEANDTAQSYLRRVLKANARNIEAQREMRLLKTRLAAKKESQASKPSLLKRLFGGFKKS